MPGRRRKRERAGGDNVRGGDSVVQSDADDQTSPLARAVRGDGALKGYEEGGDGDGERDGLVGGPGSEGLEEKIVGLGQ